MSTDISTIYAQRRGSVFLRSPNRRIFKSDRRLPEILPEEERRNMNIPTSPAQNLPERPSHAMNPNAGDKSTEIPL